MAFRDDRDALRAKNASLEEELAETREQLEGVKSELARRRTERRATKKRALFGAVKTWFAKRQTSVGVVLGVVVVALAAFFLSGPAGPKQGDVLFSGEGHVMALRGEVGVDANADCAVRIEAQDTFPWNCQVFVACGERTLYTGFTDCDIEGGEAVYAHDTAYESDNDPIMRFDREARSVLVESAAWSVTVALDPSP